MCSGEDSPNKNRAVDIKIAEIKGYKVIKHDKPILGHQYWMYLDMGSPYQLSGMKGGYPLFNPYMKYLDTIGLFEEMTREFDKVAYTVINTLDSDQLSTLNHNLYCKKEEYFISIDGDFFGDVVCRAYMEWHKLTQ